MAHGCEQQKKAVQSGHWQLMRYNPELALTGKSPLQLDSGAPTLPLQNYIYNETRYTMLVQSDPAAAGALLAEAETDVRERRKLYEHLAALPAAKGNGEVPI